MGKAGFKAACDAMFAGDGGGDDDNDDVDDEKQKKEQQQRRQTHQITKQHYSTKPPPATAVRLVYTHAHYAVSRSPRKMANIGCT